MARRQVLFVDVDGPIVLLPVSGKGAVDEPCAAYARPFLAWATGRFDVRWISRRGARVAIEVAARLGLPGDAVPIASFGRSPIEAVSRAEHPFWVAGPLSLDDGAWARTNLGTRFVQVDLAKGVVPEHRVLLGGHMSA